MTSGLDACNTHKTGQAVIEQKRTKTEGKEYERIGQNRRGVLS